MRKVVTILLLCLFFSCGFVSAPQQSVTTIERPDSARALYLYTEGIKRNVIDYDTLQARSLFLRAIECDSNYAPAHYELANSMLYDEPAKAIEHARRALAEDSTNRWYRQLYGQALLVGRRYAEALPIFEELVRTERNPDFYRLLALLYDQDKRPFSAIAILDSAERQFGINPYLGAMKRQLLLSTRQFDRALDEAQKMAEAVPYDPQSHISLGEVYMLMRKDSLAEVSFKQAIRTDSTDVMAWMALGEFYDHTKNIRAYFDATYSLFGLDNFAVEDKVNMFRQITSNRKFYRENFTRIDILATMLHNLYPESWSVQKLYAEHLISSGKIEEALTLYKKESGRADADKEVFTDIAEIENFLGRPDSATLYINRAIERFEGDAELYVRRGHLHLLAERFNEAIKGYREGLKHADNDTLRSTIWGYIGDIYHQKAVVGAKGITEGVFGTLSTNKHARKEMARCYDCYEKALDLYPDNAGVLNNYAYFLSLEERDLEQALTMAEKAISLTENNPTYLDTKAWVLHKLGRNEEAKRIMRQAISLDTTNSADLQIHYGDILAALGERFMAEIYWRKALDNGYDKTSVEQRIQSLKQQK